MPALIKPLLEEGLQIATSSGFDGSFEIDCFHDLMVVSRNIPPQTAPEGCIAQHVAQHVQHQEPFS
jgi:hypothetical protein